MKTKLNKSGLSSGIGYFSVLDRHLLSFTHELSSPLTAAQINLEDYLLSGNSDGLKLLGSNLKLMEDYLNTARQQIKRRPIKNRFFSVEKQLSLIVRSLSSLAKKNNINLVVGLSDNLNLKGNPTSFKQILGCVIKNAIESYLEMNTPNKVVVIDCYKEGAFFVVSVSDNGQGIDNMSEIFKPYYSTKNNSKGLGLGLSLASESIKEDFNGYIKVTSNESYTTSFKLYFSVNN